MNQDKEVESVKNNEKQKKRRGNHQGKDDIEMSAVQVVPIVLDDSDDQDSSPALN